MIYPIAILDLIAFLASLAALIILLRGWTRAFQSGTKGLLIGTLVFISSYNLCHFLEWSGINKALEPIEDLLGALIPMWWAFVFYAFLREIIGQREKFLSSIVKQSTEGIGVSDLNGNLVFVNDTFAGMHGYKPEEVLGKNLSIFHILEQMPFVEEANKKLKETGEFKGEIWHARRDGTTFPTIMHNSFFRGENGKPTGIVGVVLDVTEHKKAEMELKATTERLEYLLRSTSAAIYTSKASGDYAATSITENVKEITGYEPKEFIENPSFWIGHVHPEDKQRVIDDLRHIFEKGTHLHEYRFLHKNTSYIWIHDAARLIRDDSGNPTEIVGDWIDITERKKVEEALRESEARYRAIFEQAADSIVLIDTETGKLLEFNDKTYEILGYTREEFQELRISDYEVIESKEEVKKHFEKIITEGSDVFETKHRTKSGEERDMLISARTIFIQGKKYIQAIWYDITERKKVDQMKDNLIRDVSHSLKTPIALTKMACDMVEKGIKSEDMDRIIKGEEIASSNSAKALKDIEGVLKMSFSEEMGRADVKKSLSLRKIFDSVIKDQEYHIKEKNLKVKMDIPKDADKVLMRPRDLTLLCTNVVDNAIKFTKKGGINIKVVLKKGLIEIKVTDTGSGVRVQERDKVFERFYKRHAAASGMGLGLTISKEIVERNNGEIEVKSKGVNKGTTVIVRLPKTPGKGGKK